MEGSPEQLFHGEWANQDTPVATRMALLLFRFLLTSRTAVQLF